MARLTVMQLLPALDSGGVERGTLEIGEALVRAGHRSLVVSGGGRLVGPLEAMGSRHIKLPIGAKSPQVLLTVRKLREAIQSNRVQIVHARSRLPAWIAYWALKKLDPRPRWVTTLHGLNSVSRYSEIMIRADRVIAVSEACMQYWLTHFPRLNPDKVALIHRGIDPRQFPYGARPAADKISRFRAQFGIPEGRALLTLPGRVTESKGGRALVNLIARLTIDGRDCQGLFVGEVKKSDYRKRLMVRIGRLGVVDRITFTGHREDIRGIMSMSDIVFSLSKKPESFGRTAVEALALGRPVIGYDHGGTGEVLATIYPAGRVPARDEKALFKKTLQFLDSAPLVPDRQPYLKSEMQRKTIALYESIVTPGEPG